MWWSVILKRPREVGMMECKGAGLCHGRRVRAWMEESREGAIARAEMPKALHPPCPR